LICSEELGNRHQTPTLIGCMFLMIPQAAPALRLHLLANPAAISEALDYDRFSRDPSNSAVLLISLFVACRERFASSAEPWILYRLFVVSQDLGSFFLSADLTPLSPRRHQQSPRL
jgi:hypothetical protein